MLKKKLIKIIITFINTGMDNNYINRFLKAWDKSRSLWGMFGIGLGQTCPDTLKNSLKTRTELGRNWDKTGMRLGLI